MNAKEKRDITRQAKFLVNNGRLWFRYTTERAEYLTAKVKQLTGKEPRIMPEFGTLNGSPIAEMRL